MTVGKYYCDYCDKQFQDTPSARRRHLQGVQHLRAKALWYDSLKEPNQAYPDVFSKGVCNRFVKTGFCPFGDSCKYFHPKNINPQFAGTQGFGENFQSSPVDPRIHLIGASSLHGGVTGERTGMSWDNLPPSLKPPPEGGYPPLPFVDWG